MFDNDSVTQFEVTPAEFVYTELSYIKRGRNS